MQPDSESAKKVNRNKAIVNGTSTPGPTTPRRKSAVAVTENSTPRKCKIATNGNNLVDLKKRSDIQSYFRVETKADNDSPATNLLKRQVN